MSDTVSFTELDGQHVELLPARTVLSMFSQDGGNFIDDIFKIVDLSKLTSEQTDSNSTDGAAGESNS